MMEDDLLRKTTYDGRRLMMDNLKNKEDLYIGGRHTALDIFHFAVFLFSFLVWINSNHQKMRYDQVSGNGEGGAKFQIQ